MKEKVLVAMSGGVDSSVTLLKIIEMGYEAVGVTMKLWEYKDFGGNNLQENNCCAVSSINKAKLVCERMGVPHYTIDFTESFRKNVVDNFVDEYIEGKTPNPCVRCNSFIKWDTFIEQADILGAKYIATGHYAQIGQNSNGYFIKEGVDKRKDQSYVLWGIPKETLSKTILPLGDLTKEEVRQIARDNKLETAEEPESMEICFIADNNYKRFIKEYAPEKTKNIQNGKTLNGACRGRLCMAQSWPGQMRTVYGDHQRFIDTYFSQFDGKYFTGDGCRRDEDGYYWITGRVDDVIIVSGHNLGTAELESAFVAHPKVAEAAVVGYPHDIKGNGLYCYVTLNSGEKPSGELERDLKLWVRKQIGPIATPDLIQFAPGLPKTRSGKIMRRILRKIAANEHDQLGDTTTLADPTVVESLVENRKNK